MMRRRGEETKHRCCPKHGSAPEPARPSVNGQAIRKRDAVLTFEPNTDRLQRLKRALNIIGLNRSLHGLEKFDPPHRRVHGEDRKEQSLCIKYRNGDDLGILIDEAVQFLEIRACEPRPINARTVHGSPIAL